ncbi:P1 family peptidase [Aquincola tertiaricarbonis]|uniref:P1 family peptidase n=1 Tax=Aquincola tertiaricarbonis TaxID=391953 RepID=UPI0009F8DD91|nr:P1 family peptidase [Aquincola tertiaricarbonis]
MHSTPSSTAPEAGGAAARSRLGAPQVGTLPSGPRDAITDVAGVSVAHCTLADGPVQTGATVLLPQPGNLFLQQLPAGVAVINGFGKSAGLVQVQELGTLESPIALVSTLAVGTAFTALVRDAIAHTPELARSLPTVNPLVFECNDGWLNDAQALPLQEAHVLQALAAARQGGGSFDEGSVGAGRGMSCHGLKGGIGSASRCVRWQGRGYTLGALVLANQGRPGALTVAGQRIAVPMQLPGRPPQAPAAERGSIIMLLATDAPLDARQLTRVARRAAAGLARTGSDYGHGSGDIALAFSTAMRLPQRPTEPMPALPLLHEAALDGLFQAAAEATEQAILHALFAATAVTGREGHHRPSLRDVAPHLFHKDSA